MRHLQWGRLLVRESGGTLVSLAVLHAGLVAWVAWYLVEAEWSLAPLWASRTPLSGVTFHGSWAAGTLLLLAVAPLVGAAAVRGSWVGDDPTRSLPVDALTRLVWAWGAASVVLVVAGLAPLPVYLALFEMGAFTPSGLVWPVLAQSAAILLAPLAGIAVALARHRRSSGTHTYG